jgi:hypothetical protein
MTDRRARRKQGKRPAGQKAQDARIILPEFNNLQIICEGFPERRGCFVTGAAAIAGEFVSAYPSSSFWR